MSYEEASFLRAIAGEPGEDLHGLSYACWLTENGDPKRGELIRLQCSMERGVDPQTGNEVTPDRLNELQDREKELTEGMRCPKKGELGIRELTSPACHTVLPNPCDVIFRRGMLCNLSFSGIRHHHIALPPNLHLEGNLDLGYSSITELPPGLCVGAGLYLSNTSISALPPDLQVKGRLSLGGTNFTAETAGRILDMPNLSAEAKITGLESAGFPALAAEARRQARANDGPGTPPRQ